MKRLIIINHGDGNGLAGLLQTNSELRAGLAGPVDNDRLSQIATGLCDQECARQVPAASHHQNCKCRINCGPSKRQASRLNGQANQSSNKPPTECGDGARENQFKADITHEGLVQPLLPGHEYRNEAGKNRD